MAERNYRESVAPRETEQKYREDDLVFTFEDGWGRVLDIMKNTAYAPLDQVRVEFSEGHRISFYSDGRCNHGDKFPSLLTKEQAEKLGFYPPKEKRTIWIAVSQHVQKDGSITLVTHHRETLEKLQAYVIRMGLQDSVIDFFERTVTLGEFKGT